MTLKGSAAAQARRISRILASSGLPRAVVKHGKYQNEGFRVHRVGCGTKVHVFWAHPQATSWGGPGFHKSRKSISVGTEKINKILAENGIESDSNGWIDCERP